MKRILIMLCGLLIFSRFAQCEVPKDVLQEMIQSNLEKTFDSAFRSGPYWKDMVVNLSNNQPEITVSKILEDYSTNPGSKETAINALSQAAPEAVGSIGLVISANEAMHKTVSNTTDLYKDKRLTDFLDMVIKPATTAQELKKSFDTFKSTSAISGTLSVTERLELEGKMHDIFLQRLSYLNRKDKLADAQKLSEQSVSKRLKKIRADVYFKIATAQEYLVAAEMPVSSENVRKFLNNPVFSASVETKAKEIAVTASTAPAEKKGAATGKPSGADSLIGKAILIETFSVQVSSKTVDYSSYVALYKEIADRFLSDSISGELFNDATKRISRAANNAFTNALALCFTDTDKQICRSAYNHFMDDISAIRKNVDDRASLIKSRLEEIATSKEQTPVEYYAQLSASFNTTFAKAKETIESLAEAARNDTRPSFGYEVKRRAPGKPPVPALLLPEIKSRFQDFSFVASSCSAMITESERCANLLREKIRTFEPEFKRRFVEYGELYFKNEALADYSGAKFYTFQKEIDGLSGSQEMLSEDSGSFINETSISALKRNYAAIARDADSWKLQLDLNDTFVNSYAALAEKTKPFLAVMGVEKLNNDYFQSYYDKNFKEFVTGQLLGALTLLGDSIKGPDSAEPVRIDTGTVKTLETAQGKAFALLPDHEKALKDFQEKINALKDMGLDEKGGRLTEIITKVQKDYEAILIRAAEVVRVWNDLDNARQAAAVMGAAIRVPDLQRLFSGTERSLSVKLLQSFADQYSAGISRSYDTERKMFEAFKRYHSVPAKLLETKPPQDYVDAVTALGAKRWEIPQIIWAEYGKLSKVVYDITLAEGKKYYPVKSLMVGTRNIEYGEQRNIEIGQSDLRDGEVVIEGQLYPEAIKYVTSLAISLDGGKSKETIPVSESFSYKFKPREDVLYSLKVFPEIVTKEKVSTFPAADKNFTFTYAKISKDDIAKMYASLKTSYEAKSDTGVITVLEDNWNSHDGTVLAALKDNLAKMFHATQEIKYDFSNLKVRRVSPTKFETSYDLTINSTLANSDVKREEKSTVVDEIIVSGNGKPKISKTLAGRFWFQK